MATSQPAEVQLIFGQHCYQHAWHAELFEGRLPRLREFAADKFTCSPNDAAGRLLDAMQSKVTAIERMAGAYRVLMPRLVGAYEAHLALTVPITDSPTIRSLSLALTDVLQEWRSGELLLQRLLRSPEAIAEAADTVAELELLANKALA